MFNVTKNVPDTSMSVSGTGTLKFKYIPARLDVELRLQNPGVDMPFDIYYLNNKLLNLANYLKNGF